MLTFPVLFRELILVTEHRPKLKYILVKQKNKNHGSE